MDTKDDREYAETDPRVQPEEPDDALNAGKLPLEAMEQAIKNRREAVRAEPMVREEPLMDEQDTTERTAFEVRLEQARARMDEITRAGRFDPEALGLVGKPGFMGFGSYAGADRAPGYRSR